MIQEHPAPRQVRLALLALFFGLAGWYLLTMSGHVYASDEETQYYITEGLAEGRGFTLSDQLPLANRVPGSDGQFYSQYPPGQALAAVPLYLLGKAAATAAPPDLRPFITRLYVQTFNVWVTALLCVLLAATALCLGARLRVAIGVALLLGLTTLHWVYARTLFAEPLTACLTLLSFYAITRAAQGANSRWLLLAGFAAGCGLLVKPHIMLVWPMLGLYVLLTVGWPEQQWQWPNARWWQAHHSQLIRSVVLWFLGWLPPVVLQLTYNRLIFGSPFASSYSTNAGIVFDVPLYAGLYGLLVSSGKGIIFYAPIVIVSTVALREFGRTFRWAMWFILGTLLMHLLFFGRFHYWYGAGSWGPRFFVLIMPFLLLPLVTWLRPAQPHRRSRRAAVVALGLTGLAVQAIGLWTNWDTPITTVDNDRRFFVPQFSPIVLQARIARERWQSWQPVLLPSDGTATLAAGYSYAGLTRTTEALFPLKAQPLMVFFVRPRGSGALSLAFTGEVSATVAVAWDGQPIQAITRRPLPDSQLQQIEVQLPAGPGHHELDLRLDQPAGTSAGALTLVPNLLFQEGPTPLRLVQRPYIPAMPAVPFRRWQWFQVANIPHLCDIWLWYLYVAGLPNSQIVGLALPLLTLVFLLWGGMVFCVVRFRQHTATAQRHAKQGAAA